jgi:hypothetical protein
VRWKWQTEKLYPHPRFRSSVWCNAHGHVLGIPPGVSILSRSSCDILKAVRDRYDRARQIKEKQDAYCRQALSGQWSGLGEFPEDLQWEALVDVLRGRVKASHLVVFSITY